MSDDCVEIEILNWYKYNPKQAQKTFSWFRLNNDILTDQKLFGLSAAQKFCFIAILSMASKANGERFSASLKYLELQTGVKQNLLIEMLVFLEKKLVISTSREQNVLAKSPTRRDETRRDETRRDERTNENAQNQEREKEKKKEEEVNQCGPPTISTQTELSGVRQIVKKNMRFEIEKIYQKYPRKIGKGKGIGIGISCINTNSSLLDLTQAVENYAKYVAVNKIEPKFVKHFSTFMKSWTDWITPDVMDERKVAPVLFI